METIKISVEVSVNLSENTQKFLTSLFATGVPSGAQVAASVSKPAPAAPVKPAPAKPTPQPAAPAQLRALPSLLLQHLLLRLLLLPLRALRMFAECLQRRSMSIAT